jgi:hypothetical protein
LGDGHDYTIYGGLCFDQEDGELTTAETLGLIICLGELKDFYDII